MPVCRMALHVSLPVHLLSLLSPTWEAQTPPSEGQWYLSAPFQEDEGEGNGMAFIPPCSCLGHVPPPTHMNHINANWSFVIFAQWPTFPAHANRMQPSHEAAATFALAQMNDFAFKLFVWCNLLALCWIKECSIMLFIWCKVTPTQTGLLSCCSGLTFPKYWGACPQMSDHFLLCGSCSCLCSRGPRAWKVKPMQSYSFFLMDFGWPE